MTERVCSGGAGSYPLPAFRPPVGPAGGGGQYFSQYGHQQASTSTPATTTPPAGTQTGSAPSSSPAPVVSPAPALPSVSTTTPPGPVPVPGPAPFRPQELRFSNSGSLHTVPVPLTPQRSAPPSFPHRPSFPLSLTLSNSGGWWPRTSMTESGSSTVARARDSTVATVAGRGSRDPESRDPGDAEQADVGVGVEAMAIPPLLPAVADPALLKPLLQTVPPAITTLTAHAHALRSIPEAEIEARTQTQPIHAQTQQADPHARPLWAALRR